MKRALRRSYLSKRRALPFIPKITALGFCNGNQAVQLLIFESLRSFQQFTRLYGIGVLCIKKLTRGNAQEITNIKEGGHRGETDTCLNIIDITGSLSDG